jgi:hypothetical protein
LSKPWGLKLNGTQQFLVCAAAAADDDDLLGEKKCILQIKKKFIRQ